MLVLVVLIFAFIFAALATWSNENNFVTVVRSLIVTVIGGAVSFFRNRTPLENGDNKATKGHISAFMTASTGDDE